ncbi:hypothetical protein ZWY2020_005277 [Hordeum vulgare]|nr:hypothetical protein ZWY2020_005277 [Hordeum vulgare]
MRTSMYIPADVFAGILLRLPPSSRRLARLVCRQWRDVVDTRTAEMQSRAKPLVVTDAGSAHVVDDLSTGRHRVLWDGVPTDLPRERRKVVIGTCNGLICVCDNREVNGAITVINPVTGEKLSLPPLPSTIGAPERSYIVGWHEAYGFGYHPTTGRYKVVHVAAYGRKGNCHQVKVFTLGDSSWRDVATGSGNRCKYSASIVGVNGTMYWAAKRGRKLMAFDLEHERLSFVKSLPDVLQDTSWHLTDVRGRLGMVVYSFTQQCEVWVLEGATPMREHKWSRWYIVRRDISSTCWQVTRPHFAHNEYLLTEEFSQGPRNVVYKHKLNSDRGMVEINETSPGTIVLTIKAALSNHCKTFAYVETTEPLSVYKYCS